MSSQIPDPVRRRAREDVMMVMLCAITSAWLLASPLAPVANAGMGLFVVASIALTVALAAIGVKLNHLAARHARVTLGWGKRH